MNKLEFKFKHFNELSTTELYHLIRLRIQIFVVEQNCLYQDLDNKDQNAHHFMAFDKNDQLVAYTRIIAPGVSYPKYASIGRVIVKQNARKNEYGKILMEQSILNCKILYPNHPIKISAQSYLQNFYTSLGFDKVGKEYLEDGIPHMAMIYNS